MIVKLLTKDLLRRFPPLRATMNDKNPEVIAKFFTPDGSYTWYATEFDGEDLFFGMVRGQELEMGYFSLNELKNIRGFFGLPVERDRHFGKHYLDEVREGRV